MIEPNFEQLKMALKKGDLRLLDTIYRNYRLPFFKFTNHFDLPEEDITDIYQDAIIALRDNIVNGKVQTLNSSIKTYLFSIGKFMIYKKFKAIKKSEAFEQEYISEVDFCLPLNYNEDIDVLQQHVNNSFEDLGEKCKELLKLFYYDGLTLKEIQAYFNYDNYNVVKSQKSRCLRSLKNLVYKQEQNG
ncbi:RNA polymerase sigma factor [Psychroserpens ponticola]|uniref:Sigma-70 family RNA polymerase sigma factor n=1 Tax=Psychroserpens ponticola TaxID=2932268 RepID=A0ABY7S1B8_9FLAO|nr:sigma-70 family RNA polymerase sigma factor [Psychroserpens ponticola]WCO02807.1 sigma-70 family RNA polymerase sigma factor [Psychroserpens ponticola]